MQRTMAGVLVVAAAWWAAACGGEDPIATSRIIDVFQDRTGEQLIRESDTSTPSYDVLGPGDGSDEEEFDAEDSRLADKFSAFTIYVVKGEDGQSIEEETKDLLEPFEGDSVEPKDETTGIIWEESCDPDAGCHWIAQKQYGPNVVLNWFGADSKGDTDSRWDRLDTVLTEVAESPE